MQAEDSGTAGSVSRLGRWPNRVCSINVGRAMTSDQCLRHTFRCAAPAPGMLT